MDNVEKNMLIEDGTLKTKYEIRISVRTLVEFIMRSGDIDNRITGQMSKEAMAEGSRIHRKIQGQMGIEYKAEVPLKYDIEYEDFRIMLEGRADGIITNDEGVTVDEIKGMYADVLRMKEPVKVHLAQAMCYAYMYGTLHHLEEIAVQMTYCNLDDEQIKRFKTKYTYEEVREYVEEIVGQYIVWAKYIAGEKKIRKESIQNLEFPFEYRTGQRNIVVFVYKTILQKKHLFIQAPTGVGKTISTIFPAVRAVGEDAADKIFYLTAKTITRTVAEEAFETLRNVGLHFKTITITAKEKICPNEEVICNPLHCERAKGHFDRINDAIFDILTNENVITRELVERYAEKHNVCPFEMSLDISNFMDGVICDYNYVFDPYVRLKRYFSDGARGDYVFLVDEAHNLVERAREMYSAALIKEDFLRCKKIVKEKNKKVYNALEKCNKEMLALKRECTGEGNGYGYTLLKDTEELVHTLLRLSRSLEQFLDDNKEFEGRDEVLDEYFRVRTYLDFYELVDDKYVIYSDFNEDGEFFVKLFCVNPSGNLSACMEQGLSTVFFSATLLPVNYYKELLSGNVEDYAIYIDSPFDVRKRLLMVANDVSSKYTRRNREEYLRILGYIDAVAGGCSGNYMVFFPSYKLLNEVYELARESGMTENYDIICQFSNMDEKKREEFLNEFSEDNDRTMLGFCVLGGIFSEGIDLKNERLIGSVIVGTGLPQVCSEREILKNYYDNNNKNGFDYAYRYPGMNKVLQAAGRVIRTHEDFGVIALLDMRFLQRPYQMLFPREWADYNISDIENAGENVRHFWKYV